MEKEILLTPPPESVTQPASAGVASDSGLGRKRLMINSIASGLHYTLLMVVGLLYTPFLLRHLPESVYGLVPLATSMTNYLSLVLTMFAAPICRYVIADLARDDVDAANSTFNAFLFGGLKITGMLALFVICFVVVLPVKTPPGYEIEARILFLAIGLAFLISSLANCFETAYWATNRFDLRSFFESMVLILRNGMVVVLFSLLTPALWQIAVAVLIAACVHIFIIYQAWRRLTPQLRISRSLVTPDKKDIIYAVGGWLMLSHLGNQLLLSSDLFLINRYFGSLDNAKYGVILLWTSILRSLFGSIGFLVSPSLVAMEAKQNEDELKNATLTTVRMVTTLASHAAGTIAGLALPILHVWIRKPWAEEVAPIAAILLLVLCFELSCIPLSALLIAPERIERYAKVSFGMGAGAVVLCLIVLNTTDLRLYGVAISIGAVSIVRNGLVNQILATRGSSIRWWELAYLGVPMLLRFVLTAAVAYGVGVWLKPNNWPTLIFALAVVAVAVIPAGFLALPGKERRTLLRFIHPRFA